MIRQWPCAVLSAGLCAVFLSILMECAPVSAQTSNSAPPSEKRVAPKPVAPVSHDGVRYEAVPWGESRGTVAAFDAAGGKQLWTVEIYPGHYDPSLERDVQDVFVTKLVLGADGASLEIENERGECFRLDLRTRVVSRAGN